MTAQNWGTRSVCAGKVDPQSGGTAIGILPANDTGSFQFVSAVANVSLTQFNDQTSRGAPSQHRLSTTSAHPPRYSPSFKRKRPTLASSSFRRRTAGFTYDLHW
jgi:hypothetical protein